MVRVALGRVRAVTLEVMHRLRPCPPPLGREVLDEDDPARIVAAVAEEDMRLPFGELEAEFTEGGMVAAAHRRSQ